MTQNKHNYVVIVAGGSGSRLWPLSRRSSPKQFLPLLNGESMFQHMYTLLKESVPAERIIIQTPDSLAHFVREQIPDLKPENLFLEPERRDHGPAFGMAATLIAERDPEAVIGFFYADCIIKNRGVFYETLQTAYQAVSDFPEHIVTIGVKPTYPDTGYGYIQMAQEQKTYGEQQLFSVKRFTEKPDLKTAQRYVRSWDYLWNTGYKICRAALFLDVVAKVDSDMAQHLHELGEQVTQGAAKETIAATYAKLPKMSVEFLLTEKLDNLLVVPADLDWADISDWNSLANMLAEMTGDDLVTRGDVLLIDSRNSLAFSEKKLIAAVGLEDMVVIDTDDVLLIAPKAQAQRIKELVQRLEAEGEEQYL